MLKKLIVNLILLSLVVAVIPELDDTDDTELDDIFARLEAGDKDESDDDAE